MAVQASTILTKARNALVDTDDTQRWSDEELLGYLSDGQRTIAAIKPDAAQKVAVIQLVAGTRQSLPADGIALLTVNRNMLPDGSTPGRAVRIIRRDIIDDADPNWHMAPKTMMVQNYIYDPLDSQHFFVYPPSNGSTKVEINYNYSPAPLVATSDNIVLPDVYQTPLLDYVLFRAHLKESDFAAGAAAAQVYLNAFATFMQTTNTAQLSDNPNLQTTPFDPAQKGTSK